MNRFSMFGLLQNSKSVTFYFINNILAIRKFWIIQRRNFAIREGNILNIENYFRSTVIKKNVQFAYEYYKNSLISNCEDIVNKIKN
jgi:hypothetical protein